MAFATSRAREVIVALHAYAADHNGRYPDSIGEVETANDAFRELFKPASSSAISVLKQERIFSAASSPYEPDDNIGSPPDFEEALKAGENHWSMVAGLNANSNGASPLMFENSANYTTWPPRWNCDRAGQKKEGRAWKSGRIIIGRNDGSAAAELLESTKGDDVGLREEDKFFPPHHEGLRILDVTRD